jgi:hypothetical protein
MTLVTTDRLADHNIDAGNVLMTDLMLEKMNIGFAITAASVFVCKRSLQQIHKILDAPT